MNNKDNKDNIVNTIDLINTGSVLEEYSSIYDAVSVLFNSQSYKNLLQLYDISIRLIGSYYGYPVFYVFNNVSRYSAVLPILPDS